MKLLRWTFSLTYCDHNGKHHTLDCGPIALSIVGEVATIYMEEFQMKAVREEYPELKEWTWYVDDSLLKCKRNSADAKYYSTLTDKSQELWNSQKRKKKRTS